MKYCKLLTEVLPFSLYFSPYFLLMLLIKIPCLLNMNILENEKLHITSTTTILTRKTFKM